MSLLFAICILFISVRKQPKDSATLYRIRLGLAFNEAAPLLRAAPPPSNQEGQGLNREIDIPA